MINASLLILNGPNLNMLAQRDPGHYGKLDLAEIENLCQKQAQNHGWECDFRQTNHEGELVTWVQEATTTPHFFGLIINAAAYTHSSIALYDALELVSIPVIEVHLSNIFRREDFRQHSYISPQVQGVICGFGAQSYLLAIEAMKTFKNPTTEDAYSTQPGAPRKLGS